jgi:hypothetical protein
LQTIEYPYRGPRYSTAVRRPQDGGRYFGHRLNVKLAGRGGWSDALVIDRWWKFHRYEALKRVVAGGFAEHYERNEVVRGTIPKGLVAPTEF